MNLILIEFLLIIDCSDKEHLSKRLKKELMIDRCQKAMIDGQRICVDLSMEKIMSHKVEIFSSHVFIIVYVMISKTIFMVTYYDNSP